MGYGFYKDEFWMTVSAARVVVEGDRRVGIKWKMREKDKRERCESKRRTAGYTQSIKPLARDIGGRKTRCKMQKTSLYVGISALRMKQTGLAI
jgi:hypothetical protein